MESYITPFVSEVLGCNHSFSTKKHHIKNSTLSHW